MYFISPPSPNIFLMFGIIDQQFLGFGEKDGKLCFYRKSIFDIGRWKEFFLTDINVVKSDCCETGIHVATGLYGEKCILIAARENDFTRIFELDMKTMKFTRYKMLHETHPESELLNLNLCCKCVKPIITDSDEQGQDTDSKVYSFDIIPQKYHNEVGIYRILGTVNHSNNCILWKKDDSFLLNHVPLSSNIYIDNNAQVLSVYKKREEDGIIEVLSIESKDRQCTLNMLENDHDDWICHENAFSIMNDKYLTRRKENDDGKSMLRLYHFELFVGSPTTCFNFLDYCIVDAKFPSLESVHFFVYWRGVDKGYIPKRSASMSLPSMNISLIPSCIYFQTPDGSTVTIPLEVLSLSQLAYIALSQIHQPSQQQQRPLPVAKISLMHYFFQRIRNLCGESKKEEDVSTKGFFHKEVDDDEVWMSQEFIKKKIGWPKFLPLIKAPLLPFKSE